jgi:ribonuclease Z
MMRYKIHYGKVKYIFISHLHLDHFLGVFGLIQTLKLGGRTEPLEIFLPRGGIKLIEAIVKIPEFVKMVEFGEGEILKQNNFSITTFLLDHNIETYGFVFQSKNKIKFNEKKAKSLGMKGKMFTEIQKNGKIIINGKVVKLSDVAETKRGFKISYCPDTRPSKKTVKYCKESDILIHEAAFLEEDKDQAQDRKHSTAKEAAQIAKQSKSKQLMMLHLSPRYKSPENFEKEAKKVFKNSSVAEDGYIVKFA